MIYDYIIIGSGPSGGNLSYNLNKAGANCLLLEAGQFLRKETFPRHEADTNSQLYWGGGLEFSHDARMFFVRARVMGGTSIVNQCLLDRFDDIAFDDWKSESGVDFFNSKHMAPYYNQVEDFLDLHTFTENERGKNAVMFCEACEKLGYKWSYLRRGQNDCGKDQGNDCIACLGGCHRDSKQSSLATYIQTAEKEGLEISPDTEVYKIKNRGDIVKVFATKNDKQITFETKNLIMACGTFGTTKLLFQSGYKKQLPALGKYFASHPQLMWFGVFDEPIYSHQGYFQTVTGKSSFRSQGFKLENVYAPPISLGLLFNQIGTNHQEFMRKYTQMSCIEVAVRDENVGEIKVDNKGKITVNKPFTDQDNQRQKAGLDVIHNIFKAQGAKKILKSPYRIGLHLMGGCVMGTDASKSVVNPDFNLYDTKNIFIADGSIYPNAPGINPSLTIFALSQKLSNTLTNNNYVKTTEQVSTKGTE